MKNHLLVFLISLAFVLNGQSNKTKSKTGSSTTPSSNKSIGNNHTQNLVSGPMMHGNCVKKEFSVVFYVVLRGDGSVGAATPLNINRMLDTINTKFKPICVSFKNCSTVFIPNQNYTRWYYKSTENTVTNQYYTEKVINFFLVDSLMDFDFLHPDEMKDGYAYGPSPTATSDKQEIIVLEKEKMLAYNCRAALHQMGHFFGLPHTHGEINPGNAVAPPPPISVNSKEFVDRSNCTNQGDGFCDTEADPGNNSSQLNVFADGKGDYYLRPFDNYMSDYDTGCRFSQEQYNRMALIALTSRLYLH
ncbi:MAG: hypothetical protein MUF75_03705 [Bacteroidia bacterium]|jgi:hypothetical protein|nr:hypothetical protein [Bacteroidia bacterium]